MLRPLSLTIATVSFAFLAGCGKSNDSGSPPPTKAAATPAAHDSTPAGGTANTSFSQHCGKCHTVTGASPMPGGPPFKGPDLAKVAADPTHTKDWLAEHIRNPKSHKPESRMPAFEGKLSADEIKSLGDYLAGLK